MEERVMRALRAMSRSCQSIHLSSLAALDTLDNKSLFIQSRKCTINAFLIYPHAFPSPDPCNAAPFISYSYSVENPQSKKYNDDSQPFCIISKSASTHRIQTPSLNDMTLVA